MTKGEYRVGINFNPSADDMVGKIKRAAADLIDLIDSIPAPRVDDDADDATYIAMMDHLGEVERLKSLAQTHIEDAAMWAVRAATKPPMQKKTESVSVGVVGVSATGVA